ncbi:MAG: ribonuclease HI family protein [Acidobacteriia bacterium]|nr:ribonuclease HI family protein [Terriglobia bacterium]
MAERFRAAVDGGSRGNPGLAAWGVAVLGPGGRCVEGHAGTLGRATNNVAEYQALLEALKRAEAAGARDVEIRADSELIVRQVEGRYKVRHPGLVPLHAEAKRRIGKFRSFRLVHVSREENREADRLVNLALDRGAKARPDETVRVLVVPEPPTSEA